MIFLSALTKTCRSRYYCSFAVCQASMACKKSNIMLYKYTYLATTIHCPAVKDDRRIRLDSCFYTDMVIFVTIHFRKLNFTLQPLEKNQSILFYILFFMQNNHRSPLKFPLDLWYLCVRAYFSVQYFTLSVVLMEKCADKKYYTAWLQYYMVIWYAIYSKENAVF